MVRLVLKRRPSAKNPNYCDVCETFVRTHPGGAEVEISMLFADVRGSTTLAEQMRPTEFSRLMNRFFDCANRVVIDSDGLVDKLVGDEVVALYVPAIGPDRPPVRAASPPPSAGGSLGPKNPRRERCVFASHRELAPLEVAEVGARSGVGRLADRRLTRARERPQPRRDVDRVAESGEVGDGRVGANRADVRDAGVDAGTDRNEVGRRAQQVARGLDRLSCVGRRGPAPEPSDAPGRR
jgi:class 3 adenylate cyclase